MVCSLGTDLALSPSILGVHSGGRVPGSLASNRSRYLEQFDGWFELKLNVIVNNFQDMLGWSQHFLVTELAQIHHKRISLHVNAQYIISILDLYISMLSHG